MESNCRKTKVKKSGAQLLFGKAVQKDLKKDSKKMRSTEIKNGVNGEISEHQCKFMDRSDSYLSLYG